MIKIEDVIDRLETKRQRMKYILIKFDTGYGIAEIIFAFDGCDHFIFSNEDLKIKKYEKDIGFPDDAEILDYNECKRIVEGILRISKDRIRDRIDKLNKDFEDILCITDLEI